MLISHPANGGRSKKRPDLDYKKSYPLLALNAHNYPQHNGIPMRSQGISRNTKYYELGYPCMYAGLFRCSNAKVEKKHGPGFIHLHRLWSRLFCQQSGNTQPNESHFTSQRNTACTPQKLIRSGTVHSGRG